MSLRTRLVLTHVFIILLTLAILAVALAFILRDYQRQVQLSRLGDAVIPLAFQARAMAQNDVAPREILARLQPQAGDVGNVMVVTDKGLVLADAANGLTNRNIALTPLARTEAPKGFVWGAAQTRSNTRPLLYAAISVGQLKGQNVYIALAVQERPLFNVLDEIGASLFIAGSITLIVSLLVALLLARSIAGPLSRLTRATEAIARGQYDHRVQAKGSDEIGRLAASFNTMAEQVQRSRQMEKDFVANVSHELKTPLTSIQGFAQAILDGAVADIAGAQRAAQTIYDETARMARLVGDLLTLARLESGQIEIEHATIDLADVLPRWVERLQPRANAANAQLVTVVEPLPCIAGDAGKLEQVITNLVDNAIKYNRPGGAVTVTARTHAPSVPSVIKSSVLRRRTVIQPETHWVTIAIADTGFGIPQEDLPRLFERFYRGDKARVAGGTGLGLSIAKEIVAAHGGKITVQSETGQGTTFTVHLPAQKA
ncbi:two-component system, OmpR family, sensor histidine kinase ResE [Anaerolineae bacterium]|nr:two-component system, OmpR family, sensor histidine kinase ResE [Anaerolineae bacterium]